MQAFELTILNWIQAHLRCGVLDAVMVPVSRICDHGEVWILLAAILLAIPKTRKLGTCVACGLALDLLFCNLALKPLIGRGTALRRQPHRLLADPAACGRLLPLRPHGSLLRIGSRAENSEQPPLEARTGAGRGHRPVPAVPLRPLAHRYSWGRCRGYSGRLAGNKAGAVISPEKSVKNARKHLTCFRVSVSKKVFSPR